MGALAAGATSDEAGGLTAPSTPGTYYYGACVDAVAGESDTENNCSEALTVMVEEPAPDLVVLGPNVSDSSPETGGPFRLIVTVQNVGERQAAATSMQYYRSTDATITTSDTSVGTAPVPALGAWQGSAKTISLTAPSRAATYYYGGCVDAVPGESDTANNCSTSVQVDVSEPPPPPPPPPTSPDLVVGLPSVSDGSLVAGDSFTLSATVRNDGDGASAATTLRYYRSTDAAITNSDTGVGTNAVERLSAGATSDQSVDLTAPSSGGTYYYGACVAAVAGESDTTNNCSGSVQVVVSEPPPQTSPDLAVGAPTVSDDNPVAGAAFILSATVRNDGDGDAAATTLRYFRSADATITTDDAAVGTDAVAELAPSATSEQAMDLTAPAAGTYYYGACVDAVTGESDTENNCSTAARVDVAEPPPQTSPDLVVGPPSVSDDSPVAGAAFTLSATVRNRGDGDAAATTMRYFRSADATITTDDTAVGTDAVAELAPSATSEQAMDLTAPAAGTYYYGACVDAVTGESDTENNCSTAARVDVAEPPPQTSPDLVVVAPSVSDDSPVAGAAFTLSATVRNDGDGDAAATTLRYYRSPDDTITTDDTAVGTDAVAELAPSATSEQAMDLTAPAAGTYYYGACVDAVTGESDTENNCSTAARVDVAEPPPQTSPDLVVVAPSVSDDSPVAGAAFTLSATVRNDGDGDAAATTLRYFRSPDDTITTDDTAVGTDAVAELAPSATSEQAMDLTAPAAGTYYYGACVDAVTGESDTENNCSTAARVDVAEPPPQTSPDLVVVAPSVSDDSPVAGAAFTLSATVRNDGDGDAAATTLRYFRSPDDTITTDDTAVGTDAVAELAPSATSEQAMDLTAPAAGTYYYGACVDAVTGESDTENNCSTAARVDVAEPPPQTSPDLVVGPPSVSDDSPVAGAEFTLSATVRNSGDGDATATTLRYYRSPDDTITTDDTAVGTDAVAELAPSATSEQAMDLTAPAAGTYYYGACVDAVTGESDTENNCSTAARVDVAEPPPQTSPDLVVVAPSVSDDSPVAGAAFTLSATVRNDGDGDAAATTMRYYQSADATITTADIAVGTDAAPGLAPSATSEQSVDLSAPAAGRYHYGACVDAVAGESDIANNCSTAVRVDVSEPVPALPLLGQLLLALGLAAAGARLAPRRPR